jgi:hypothetical protein
MKRWKKGLLAVVICLGLAGATMYVFRETIFLTVLEIVVRPGHPFDPALAPPAPDYSDPASWAALPDKDDASDWTPPGLEEVPNPLKDKVDVFYVHPTGFLGRDNWNGTPGQRSRPGISVDRMLAGQASALNACGHLYAPHYRQATLYSFFEGTKNPEAGNGYRALELAYSDVARAFDHFIEHFNKGRPFVLASHSQGTAHMLRLLAERVDQTELHSRMIAAYAIGYSMPDDMFDRVYRNLRRCTSPTDTGCVIHWDTFAEGSMPHMPHFHWYPEGWESAKGKKTYCINPLSWTSEEERVSKEAHLGAVIAEVDESSGEITAVGPFPQYTWAQCHEGVLWVGNQSGTPFSHRLTIKGNYHILDYPLFWFNIRHNAVQRSKAFFASNASAVASAVHETTDSSMPGLVWVFFNDTGMTRPHETGVDHQINVDTADSINDFSKVWLGRVAAPVAGDVTFVAEADNGLRLWVGDKLVIDGWTEDGVREGTINFPKPDESHPFRLEFFQYGGTAHMRLNWRWDGHPQELIPLGAFSYEPAHEAQAQEMLTMKKGAEHVPLTNANARVYMPGQPAHTAEPIRLKPGPHLFIDDHLIESSTQVRRQVNMPVRDDAIPNPIVTGKEDGCFQPYMTILRDPDTNLFRIWYGRRTEDSNPGRSRIGYTESEDGIHWRRPARVLPEPGPIQFGISVIDEGPHFPDPSRRYKFGWYMDGGLKVAVSPDGLAWTPVTSGVVLPHNHDINSIAYDPVRARYVATISVYRGGETWTGNRRITMHSHSDDLVDWSIPHYVVLPDPEVDDGETQFYAMEGYLARGDLIIGMVKVLRDDLKVDDPPDPPEAYGVGYTTLAWTRDGETWTRDPAHFFDPHPQKGTWDHAHAWIDEQVPVGDDVYLYYGGYARGHKVNRFEERQIGLVRMKRDRYVAREAGSEPGLMQTPLLFLDGVEMTLNVDARNGSVAVQAVGEDGLPAPGFAFDDCEPVCEDTLVAPVVWKRSLADLVREPVRLEFRLENARLYAFDLK